MPRGGKAGAAGPRRPPLARPSDGSRGAEGRGAQTRGAPAAPSPAKRAALPPGLVFLGEFGRPHGLAGEVRLKSHTGEPKAIAGYGPLTGADGRSYIIKHARQAAGDQPDLLVARVEGVATREAAEALNRMRLYAAREALGEPEEDEFFLADLVGLSVEGPDGPIGQVAGVPDYGSGELLEVAITGRRQTLLLPFSKAFVPVVDIAARRVVVAPPEGWLDEGENETSPD